MCPSIALMAGGGDLGNGSGKGAGKGEGDVNAATGEGGENAEGDARGAPDYEKYPQCGYASHPVDVVTGRAFTHPIADLELPGPLPLVFRRMFSSKMATRDAGLGFGWGHTFGWEVEVGRRRITVWNEQGVAVDFPMIPVGAEVIGPWGWLLRRESWGFAVDADDGVWHLFSAADEGGRTYRLTAVEDRNRNRISITYDDGKLAEIVDSAGRTIKVTSTREGRIAGIYALNAISQGQWVAFATYTYDERGNLTSVTDADGHVARYEYDDDHRLTLDLDRAGLAFHFVYDGEGRCVESWGDYPGKRDPSLLDALPKFLADGTTRAKGIHHCRFDYQPEGYTEVADSTQVRRFFGTKHGTLKKKVEGGAVMTAIYRDDGHLLAQTDAMGGTTQYERDARGRITKVTDPLGRVTVVTLDAAGLPIEIVDAAGGVTAIARDTQGNMLAVTDPLGAVTSYRYDARGLVSEKVAPDGSKTIYEYDAHHNPSRMVLPNGGEWRFVHDALGRILSETDPEGKTTRFGWSARGDLLAIYDAAGGVTRYDVDGEGRVVAIVDPDGSTRRFTWGGYHRLAMREDGNGHRVKLGYDREGQLLQLENERGMVHRFEYGASGRLVGETTFDGQKFTYKNDLLGRPVEVRGPTGKSTLEYDLAGQLIKRERGEIAHAFEYDALGNVIAAIGSSGELRFERDALGRIVREIQRVGDEEHVVEAAYDLAGHRVSRSTSLGHTAAIERDALGQRARTRLDGRGEIGHRLDLLGREILRQLSRGGAIETELDPLGRITRRRVFGPNSQPAVGRGQPEWVGPLRTNAILERAFRYDPRGDILDTWDSARGATTFEYDRVGQLLAYLPEKGAAETFRYDPAGNRYEGERGQREYSQANRLILRGNTEYRWDDAGRLVEKRVRDDKGSDAVWGYRYNDAGQLAQVAAPDGAVVDFSYDALGRRTQKRVSKPRVPGGEAIPVSLTRFVWDGDALVHEIKRVAREAGNPVVEERTYLFEDDAFTPLAHKDGAEGPWFHYVTLPNGAPDRLVDDAGDVACELAWDAQGKAQLVPGGRTSTPLRLRGQYADEETGLSYNRFRYYDPEAGTFITPDPIGLDGGLNTYSFGPSTIGFSDPYGLAGYRKRRDFMAAHGSKFASKREADAAWHVYKETNRDCTKPPAIGRLADTAAAEQIGMRRLNNPNWTPAVNDAWVQGGIDRGAPFYLASPDIPANRVNPPGSRFPNTVFDRELNQLQAAGYRKSACGTWMLPPGMSSPPP
jgi:RHS repeat-associated protein